MSSSTVVRGLGRAVLCVGAILTSTWPSLVATASAQEPIVINSIWAGGYNLTSPPGLFAGHIAFSVDVTAVNAVASVTATFAGRTVSLQRGSFLWSGDDMATGSLPFGPTPIEIRATDVVGNSVATLISRVHDNPPTIEIVSPLPDTLVRSSVLLLARCTDDGGPCQMAVDGMTGFTGTNVVDRMVSLADLRRSSGGFSLTVRATDSQGQVGVERRNLWVESSPRLSLVASYPGVIQDIDTGRALVFSNESPRRVLIVDRLTGVAQPIFVDQSLEQSTQSPFQEGQLTPSGALFTMLVNGGSQLYEWTPAALVPLGRVVNLDQFVGKMRVEGPWALFSRQRQIQDAWVYDLIRRDARSGDEVVLMAGTTFPSGTSDLAANGDVVFQRPNGYGYDLVRYRQGVFEALALAATGVNYARTDGTVVVAAVSYNYQGWACRVFAPTGEEVLAQHQSGFSSDVRAQEGWAACRMPFSPYQTWTRAPSGARQLVQLPSGATVDAVGDDGSLLYSQAVGVYQELRRYLRRGTIPAIEVGSGNWPVQHIDGIWYVFAGPHLFRIIGPENLLSEGATGSFFDQQIALLNPGAELASVHTHYLKEGGEPARHRFVPARSRLTISVDDEPDMASAAASTVVESTTPLVVERTMTWDARGYGGHSGSAVDGARRRWLFAEGAQGYFDTFILLVNNDFGPATVRLTFLVEHGSTVIRTVTMAPRSRVTVRAGAIPELANASFATVVDASAPIAAERAMYFGPAWTGGHESAGVSEPSTRWFHAEGATGSVFDTFILLANPGTEAANVVVTFLTAGGTTVTRQVALPALSRKTINPETVDAQLASTSFATAVQSDVPIVSERAMYWSTVGGGWQEAHNSFGVTTTGTKWGTADGRAGGPRGYQTYVLVANPSPTATARLVAIFMRSDGVQVNRTIYLGPNRRLTIDCGGIPELANSEFGVVVESTNAVPIVVERATYWNADGIVWAGGTNVTATPVP